MHSLTSSNPGARIFDNCQWLCVGIFSLAAANQRAHVRLISMEMLYNVPICPFKGFYPSRRSGSWFFGLQYWNVSTLTRDAIYGKDFPMMSEANCGVHRM